MADATWYGSFRGMVHSQDGHTTMQSNGSRWGVKGSSEVSEGLTAVYRYEENLDLGTASLKANNRLSYVGLSGGFGTITMGRIWSATYNHVGVLTDNGVWSGNSGLATTRTSNTVSYSASAGPASFQLDLQMDPKGEVAEKSIDMMQLGVTFDAGGATIGAAVKSKDRNVLLGKDDDDNGLGVTLGAVRDVGITVAEASDALITDILGKKFTGKTKLAAIAASVPVGGISLHAGWHEAKHEVDSFSVDLDESGDIANDGSETVPSFTTKSETKLAGVSGAIGDTGLSFAVNIAEVEVDGNEDRTPWNFNISKSLGGGASVAFEHINADTDADDETETLVQLRVDF